MYLLLKRIIRVYSLFCCVQIFSWRIACVAGDELPEPVAFYPLNKQYGTRDISKSYLPPGTAIGVTLAAGPDGKADGSYSFQGSSSSYIDIPQHSKLDTRYSMSTLMWIYNQGTYGPVLNYDTGDNAWGVHMYIHVTGVTSSFYVSPIGRSAIPNIRTITYGIATNGWNYIGYTYDYSTGKQRLYVDGVMAREVVTPISQLKTNFKIKLGGSKYGAAGSFTGRLSCLQIYDKALTQAQVKGAQLYCKANVLEVYKACFDYQSIIPSTRAPDNQISGQPSDRNTLSRIHWYRLKGNALQTLRIATSCPNAGSCGTQSPGWLNGQYPSREAGITRMEICYRTGSNCCGSKGYVFVRQCYGYYVFKFDDLPNTNGRFCTKVAPNNGHDIMYMSTNGKCLVGHVFYTETDVSEVTRCMGYCVSAGVNCKSFNFISEGNGQCQLNNAIMTEGSLAHNAKCTYYEPV